jgi:hypothetical protein
MRALCNLSVSGARARFEAQEIIRRIYDSILSTLLLYTLSSARQQRTKPRASHILSSKKVQQMRLKSKWVSRRFQNVNLKRQFFCGNSKKQLHFNYFHKKKYVNPSPRMKPLIFYNLNRII